MSTYEQITPEQLDPSNGRYRIVHDVNGEIHVVGCTNEAGEAVGRWVFVEVREDA